jgi:arylsulfatase A-like enzyme
LLTQVVGRLTNQLFNLRDDPWEMNNLADDTSFGSKKQELRRELKAWMLRLDDFCDLDRPGWVRPEGI